MKYYFFIFLLFPITTFSSPDLYKQLFSKHQEAYIDKTKYAQKNEIYKHVSKLIDEGEYKELSNNLYSLLETKELALDRKLKHTEYYDQLTKHIEKMDQLRLEKELENIETYIKKNKNDSFGYIYYSMLVRAEAWMFRGNRTVDLTSNEAINYFSNQLIKNTIYMIENKDILSKDPIYYVHLTWNLMYLGQVEDMTIIYKEGIHKFPDYLPIYSMYLGSFNSKFFGYNLDVAKMVLQDIEERNQQKAEFYYYKLLLASNAGYRINLFEPNWDKVEEGMVTSLVQMPSRDNFKDVWRVYCSYDGNRPRIDRLINGYSGFTKQVFLLATDGCT